MIRLFLRETLLALLVMAAAALVPLAMALVLT